MDKLNAISVFDALSHERRLDIFRLLVEVGPDGLMVGEIGQKLSLPQTSLAFHLAKLEGVGLVRTEKQGRATICRVDFGNVMGAIGFLLNNCCGSKTMQADILAQLGRC